MGRSVIPLAAFIWSIAALALVREPIHRSRAVSATPQAPTLGADPLLLAERILIQAERLESGSVGYAAVTPASVLAWRVIMDSPHPASAFREVFAEAGIAGELYALAGLRFADPAAYTQFADDLRQRGGSVDVVRGCIGSTDSITQVIAEIDTGEWARGFYTGGQAPPPPRTLEPSRHGGPMVE